MSKIIKPKIGAIRWDAQSNNLVPRYEDDKPSYVMSREARYLSYPQFFRRLPFYAQVSEYGMSLYQQWKSEGSNINAPNPSHLPWEEYAQTAEAKFDPDLKLYGAMQTSMDKEIEYAVNAGIDYWAFVYYKNWESDKGGCYQMAAQRNMFIGSKNKRGLKWCPILYISDDYIHYSMDEENWIIEQMKNNDFMTVQDGRPLVFFSLHSYTSRKKTIEVVNRIRKKAEMIGKNPFIVANDWDWEWSKEEPAMQCVEAMKADAVTWYATTGPLNKTVGDKKTSTYLELHSEQKAKWASPFAGKETALSAGVNIEVIPNVTVGIDTRPRSRQDLVPMLGDPPYWGNLDPDPTPHELECAVFDALKHVFDNKSAKFFNSILLYCWNEFTEGGLSVCPHFDPDNPGKANTMVVDAIKNAKQKALKELDWTVDIDEIISGKALGDARKVLTGSPVGGIFPYDGVLKVTVTFDTNGGFYKEVFPSQVVDKGEKINKVQAPEPPDIDMKFAGWYSDFEFTHKWDFESDTADDNTILHAKWEK